MKKSILILTALSVVLCGFAQKFPQSQQKVSVKKNVTSINQPAPEHSTESGMIFGDTLYSNDFSNAGDFTLNPVTSSNGVWVIGLPATIGTGYFGRIYAPGEAFASSTGANGYALFDSDLAGEDAFNDASFTLGPISIPSTSSNISINFEQWYARFADSAQVWISADGTSFTMIGDNSDVEVLGSQGGEATPNGDLKSIDISSYDGQTVYFRFRYKGNWDYSWLVDDITITEYSIPETELDLVRIYTADLDFFLEQAITPLAQVDSLRFGTVITNNGTAVQSPVINYVIKKNGIAVKTGSVTNSSIAPSVTDTSYYNTGYVPDANGTYTYEITLPAGDSDPSNNSGTADVSVTEFIYSPTPADLSDATIRSLSNLDGSGAPFDFYKVGTRFLIYETATLYAINVGLFRPTAAENGPIDVLIQIYDGSGALEPGSLPIGIGDYRLSNSHPAGGNYTSIVIDPPVELEAGKVYVATIGYEADNTKSLQFLASNESQDDDSGTLGFGPFGADNSIDWYRGWEFSPAIQLNFNPEVGGFGDLLNGDKLFVSPNPANNQLNVKLGMKKVSTVSMNLVDMNGRVVFSKTVNNKVLDLQETINLAEFAAGIYNLQVNTDNGSSNQKVVVAH